MCSIKTDLQAIKDLDKYLYRVHLVGREFRKFSDFLIQYIFNGEKNIILQYFSFRPKVESFS